MRETVERYLRDLVTEAQGVLADALVGAYAAGSVALDAFDPARSDIDVALVTRGPLAVGSKQRLVSRLRHETLACPARGLELVVYQRWAALSGTADPAFELEFNTGPGMAFRATLRPADRPAEDGLFWYGLDRDILHAHGLRLTGPPAAQVFTELDRAAVRTLLLDSLAWWHRRTPSRTTPTPGAEEAVLGACRALLRHRRGLWFGKVEAARALVADGHGSAKLLLESIAARAGGTPPTGTGAREFQEQVIDELIRDVP